MARYNEYSTAEPLEPAPRPQRPSGGPGASSATRPLRVVVLTPGVGGLGGISRMMDAVGEEMADRTGADVAVSFVGTRGDVPPLRPLVFLRSIVQVAARCATGRCDMLHVNVASFGSTFRKMILSSIARACGTPYVIHLHGGQYEGFWASRGPRASAAIGAFFRNAAGIVVLGGTWERFVRDRLPEVAPRITVLPNATRAPALPRRDTRGEDVIILFLGQLNASKGVPQLVEALAGMSDLAGWRAVLAGNGDVEGTREAVERHGLAGRVDVPGWVGPDRVDALLREAGVFVLPSFVENLPLSIVEAFAYGVPVVCTPVGSVPEIVEDGRTGLLVPAGDAPALEAALRRLVGDPQLRESLAGNGRAEHAARFQLSTYVDRLVGLWKTAAR